MIIDRATLRIRCYETSDYPDVLRLHEATLRGVGAYAEDEEWDEDLRDIESTYLGDR